MVVFRKCGDVSICLVGEGALVAARGALVWMDKAPKAIKDEYEGGESVAEAQARQRKEGKERLAKKAAKG